MTLRTGRLGFMVTAAFLFFGTACDKAKDKKEDGNETKPVPVRVHILQRSDVREVLRYGASLSAWKEVNIFSAIPDRILSFPWQDGDLVEAGQVLALIRKDGMDQGMRQVTAQIASLDVQLSNMRSELARGRDLLSKGVMTQQAFDQINTGLEAAQANRQGLMAARGQLAATLENAVIKAPIGGVFAGKRLEEGDMALPSVPLGRILVTDPLKVDLRLMESDVSKVALGMKVRMTLDAWPGREFEGAVTRIRPFLDAATRTNTVEISLPNPVTDEKTGMRDLKPGMYGVAELIVGERPNVLVAPEPALLLDNRIIAQQQPGEVLRKAFVVAPDNQTAHQRVVRLGTRNGANWEVLDGLAEGERIVVRGQHGLKEDSKIEVVSVDNEATKDGAGTESAASAGE